MQRVINEIAWRIEKIKDATEGTEELNDYIIEALNDIDTDISDGRFDRGFVRQWHEFLIKLGMCTPLDKVLYTDSRDIFTYKGRKYICTESFSLLTEDQINWIKSLIAQQKGQK